MNAKILTLMVGLPLLASNVVFGGENADLETLADTWIEYEGQSWEGRDTVSVVTSKIDIPNVLYRIMDVILNETDVTNCKIQKSEILDVIGVWLDEDSDALFFATLSLLATREFILEKSINVAKQSLNFAKFYCEKINVKSVYKLKDASETSAQGSVYKPCFAFLIQLMKNKIQEIEAAT